MHKRTGRACIYIYGTVIDEVVNFSAVHDYLWVQIGVSSQLARKEKPILCPHS